MGAVMIDTMVALWSRLPLWGKWASGIFALFFLNSIGPAFHERHFLPAFLGNFAALTLHWGLIALGFGGAVWLGMKIATKTGKTWLGWVTGLAFLMLIAGPITFFFQGLPGVGKRLSALSDTDCYVDWDGRTNPTVCD